MRYSRLIRAAALAALAGLAACGSDPSGQEIRTLASGVLSAGRAPAPVPDPGPLAQRALSVLPGPVMLAEIASMNAVAVLALQDQNGPYQTWTTVDGQQIMLRGGVLTGTRGLGDDIMSSDAGAAIGAVARRGAGQGAHVYRTLDGQDSIEEARFECRIAPAGSEQITLASGLARGTVRIEERCAAGETAFTNTYWADPAGTVWQSRQWIGPNVGFVTLQLLRR